MNEENFKKLVKKYITVDKYANMDLILKTFDSYKPNNANSNEAAITLENKLLYIPASPFTGGTFVFSDGSQMYIYSTGPKPCDDDFCFITGATGWSTEHNWIIRNAPISVMNMGVGWRVSAGLKNYYVLNSSIVNFHLNWTIRNPLNLK